MEVPSLYGCLKYTTAPLEQSDSQSEISSKSQLLPFEVCSVFFLDKNSSSFLSNRAPLMLNNSFVRDHISYIEITSFVHIDCACPMLLSPSKMCPL